VRGQILDLLFKPHFGAGFQHLKVEIGGDVNSTAGVEPSHMRTPQDANSDRGYEWWLMKEARRRNPHLPLDALEWGAPAWIGEFYSRENADYLVEYLRQAKTHHSADVNYLGIRNEVRYDAGWIKLLRQTLDRRGFAAVKIVAPDEVNRWSIVPLMQTDPELAHAVDVVGVHYPQFMSTAEAQTSGKRLWASEDGAWNSDWAGAKQLAKILNRNYIEGKMTKTIVWSLVAAYYDLLPNPSTGVIRANEPWSGNYRVQPSLWAIAHTTQFTEPGWTYVAPGCGYLPMEGSIVTLRSTNQTDFSMIAETVDATQKQQVAFQLDGGLVAGQLRVWRSSGQEQFERLPDLVGTNGLFATRLEPGSIYSLTSTTGQTKGQLPIPPALPFPPRYAEDFESYAPGASPRFFSDQGGAFEVALRADHAGRCLRQVIARKGIEWESHLTPLPETFLGDANWRDYTVGVDALLESEGFVSLFGRVGQIPQGSGPPRAYWLKVADTGFWELGVEKHPIASGKVGFSTNSWHHLQLDFDRTIIEVRIDHTLVGSVSDQTYLCGMVGVGSGWHGAQFDNLHIQAAPWDRNLALGKPTLASSQADADSTPSQANDGNAFSTRWTAAPGKTSGEWLEVDFGALTEFDTVVLKSFVEQISQYSIQFWNGTEWLDAAVGQKLEAIPTLIAFPSVTATKTRFYARQAAVPPSLWEFEVFDNSRGRPRDGRQTETPRHNNP
jgi:Glycosyl hydrolase family 59/F5/8 type C domain